MAIIKEAIRERRLVACTEGDNKRTFKLRTFSICKIEDLVAVLCSLVVSFPGYRSRGPGSIPSATRFSEK
jgi:hypothetical protein